jgi:signal transduction histidine kinase
VSDALGYQSLHDLPPPRTRFRALARTWSIPVVLILLAALLTIPWTFWVILAAYELDLKERAESLALRVRIQTSGAWFWQSHQQVLKTLEPDLLADPTVQAIVIVDESNGGRVGAMHRSNRVPIPRSITQIDQFLANTDPNSYRHKFEWRDGLGNRRAIYIDLSQAEMRRKFWDDRWPLIKKIIVQTFSGFIVVSTIGIFAYRVWGRASQQRQRSELEQQGLLAERGLTAAVLAHDLRNPLAALRFPLHSLKRAPDDTQRVTRTAETIDGELGRIQQLVQDYLAHERAQTLRVIAVPLDEAVRGLQTLMGELLRESGTRLVVHQEQRGVMVVCDPHALRQILMNLVLNAQQAMGNNGLIAITIGQDGDFGTVAVSDTGPGIPEEMKDRLFKPFVTSKQGGSGIGLALVKRFVDNFGGSVSVDSQIGKGTTFKLKLPLAQKPAAENAPPLVPGMAT